MIPVIHGAPLVHRPRLARADRLILARISTDCAIGRGAEGDLRPVHVPGSHGHAFYERDGDIWARVRISSPALAAVDLSPDHFESLLRTESDVDDQANMAFRRYFARTPLAPRDAVTGRHVAFEAKRAQGEDLPRRGPGLVVEDFRERSASDLRAFLSNEILVTGEGVYTRCAPLIRGYRESPGGALRFRVDPSRTFEPQLFEEAPIPPDGWIRYPAAPESGAGRVRNACVLALEEEGLLSRDDDADLRILANTLPGWIVSGVVTHNANGEERGVPGPLLEALKRDALMGMTGAITASEAPAAVLRIAKALRGYAKWANRQSARHGKPDLGSYALALVDHIEDSAVPRAEWVPEQDEEALSSLASGF